MTSSELTVARVRGVTTLQALLLADARQREERHPVNDDEKQFPEEDDEDSDVDG